MLISVHFFSIAPAGECEGDNSADEETEDEDESEGFGMTM